MDTAGAPAVGTAGLVLRVAHVPRADTAVPCPCHNVSQGLRCGSCCINRQLLLIQLFTHNDGSEDPEACTKIVAA